MSHYRFLSGKFLHDGNRPDFVKDKSLMWIKQADGDTDIDVAENINWAVSGRSTDVYAFAFVQKA